MAERNPDDIALLAAANDPTTGVEYIPTGASPYVLHFRRMVHRMLRAAERANDLRVYQDGDLTFGVRPGRCRIADTPIDFAGVTAQATTAATTTYVWLDDAGAVQTGASAFPTDATSHIRLAVITTDASAITSIADRRGEYFFQTPTVATLGLTATVDEINQALDGVSSRVTAAALNTLTDGPTSLADFYHSHAQSTFDADELATYTLANLSSDSAANVALVFSLPEINDDDTILQVNPDTQFLEQLYGSDSYNLLGANVAQHAHAGDLSASLTGELIGVVPVSGTVSAVVLSAGANIQSSTGTDNITAVVKVNGAALTSTHPALASADGSGFRCTDQGDGTPASVVATSVANVNRGDVLTVDLTRTAGGTVSVEAANVVVAVVIRAARPE